MNSKKVRKILIVCIIINLIVLFAIISITNKKDKNEKAEINNKTNTQIATNEIFKSKTVLYKNYKGALAKTDIIEKIDLIVDQYFPILKNELEGKSSEEYFTSRTAAIKKRFGITNYKDFEKLAKQVKKINCPLDKYISSELVENSFKVKDNYTVATLIYTYENKQTIELDFYMLNDISNESDIKYVILPK